ncbi:hypothetical protein HELRODRAFT_192219 [Helobdella robusta]|uniref:Uncharacterized protein n=1 Tax=Helobdella robusta TaxID=6412 RepID=T1FTQ3_HELRO|nr:hypothetical protein HELRODRAFT_192219 [Helobdella robusta]ESO01641.1 hypothetical protein HELRODRAFT_192219 [Helobdella robusta]
MGSRVAAIPWFSLVATVVMCVGVGLFCGAGFRAAEIVNEGIFKGLFHFYVEWLQSTEIGFFVFGLFMGLFSIFLLTFAFLASFATRGNIYSGVKCIMGGRISAFVFLVLTYVLDCVWIWVTSFVGLAIFLYMMLFSICSVEVQHRTYQYLDTEWEYCLNLSRFGIYRNFTAGMDLNALCDESDLDDFCDYISKSGPQFIIAFVGSFLVVLGLIMYSMELGAKYTKIQSTKEITQYSETFALNDASHPTNFR